jgi:hypothetical protein
VYSSFDYRYKIGLDNVFFKYILVYIRKPTAYADPNNNFLETTMANITRRTVLGALATTP